MLLLNFCLRSILWMACVFTSKLQVKLSSQFYSWSSITREETFRKFYRNIPYLNPFRLLTSLNSEPWTWQRTWRKSRVKNNRILTVAYSPADIAPLDYYYYVQQILSGSSGSWVRILLSFITNLFFLSNWRNLHFHEHIRLEISPKCDIKAENSSTMCKFHEGIKGLRPMGSNADPCMLRRVAQLLRLHAASKHCLHFIYAHKFACIRSYKLCHSGNPPGQSCYIYFDLFISW